MASTTSTDSRTTNKLLGPTSTHRITRRKSMSASNNTNVAAVAAAIEGTILSSPSAMTVGGAVPVGVNVSGLGKLQSAGAVAASLPNTHGYPSPPSSLPDPPPPPRPFGAAFSATTPSATFATPALPSANTTSALSSSATAIQTQVTPESIQLLRKNPAALLSGSAIADGHGPDRSNAARSRRASEGAGVLGATGKLGRMRSGSELKCDKCGKGYKHSSCLTKHLWEHTPEWSYTSKLLISKHQQVQLLEAASILVSMNPTPPDSSTSAEGASDSSSDDTTPPPSGSITTPRGIRHAIQKSATKRYSSSGISRSFSTISGSAPTTPSFPNHIPQRPRPRAGSSAGSVRPVIARGVNAEDDALAAAVELLSCSFKTPSASLSLGSPPAGGRRFVGPLNDVVEKGDEDEDEDEDMEWRERSEEIEEDGVFGTMEE
ncbi:hypothetical protein FPQ18DRAFT_367049 [Pyronema domesticum]|uniref:C2H2-type domain-containing protein n=1 Tax=Pyronema omphalodes (strain CBS 100304) TaxID=1076935 RepID=U4LEE6_PYROM|nr:hypothetical protein FPQ18DRAFT_367049 [Pyronema domesticum]CCX09659.1 Similar to hypothetical protein [Tuber melanosporum Mel28]; acc. no. XP_002835278 [Pyronema omphalodes CBS 100304]